MDLRLKRCTTSQGCRQRADPRAPDIPRTPDISAAQYRSRYTGSTKKQAEHGGFAQDDTNGLLIVSNPRIEAGTLSSFVETSQVAPTILKVLELDPSDLDAVRKEGPPILPGLHLEQVTLIVGGWATSVARM